MIEHMTLDYTEIVDITYWRDEIFFVQQGRSLYRGNFEQGFTDYQMSAYFSSGLSSTLIDNSWYFSDDDDIHSIVSIVSIDLTDLSVSLL